MGFVAPFFYFFAVITSLQMRRAEGGMGLLSLVQLTTAVVATPGWLYPMSQVAVAAYRPERSPIIIQMAMMIWGLLRAIKSGEQEEMAARAAVA